MVEAANQVAAAMLTDTSPKTFMIANDGCSDGEDNVDDN